MLASSEDRRQSSDYRDVDPHASRLSDVGARIARVAHEINVPLSLISGSLDALSQYVDVLVEFVDAMKEDGARPPLRQGLDIDYARDNTLPLLDICREGTTRLTRIVEQLRLYTRRDGNCEFGDVDLVGLITDAARLATRGREPVPQIHLDLRSLPAIRGDADGLTRVFVNLIGNAIDAVKGRPDGAVWISAHGMPAPAKLIRIVVRDNGPGVPEQLRDAVFEPFFTTKPRNAGLGLGLAISAEIVQAHGGGLSLQAARETEGAVFVVTLPLDGIDRISSDLTESRPTAAAQQ